MLANIGTIVAHSVLHQYHREMWSTDGSQAQGLFNAGGLFEWLYFGFSIAYLSELAIALFTQPWRLYFVQGGRLVESAISLAVSVVSILWVLPQVGAAHYITYSHASSESMHRMQRTERVLVPCSGRYPGGHDALR